MERPRELPRTAVDEGAARRHQLRKAKDRDARLFASAYGAAALSLIANLFSRRDGGGGMRSRVIMVGSKSSRRADQILAELQAFYDRRPRPWRPAAFNTKPRHRRIVYDKLARRGLLVRPIEADAGVRAMPMDQAA